jgi:hypothetical protein
MPASRPSVTTTAKDLYLVNKITLLQNFIFAMTCKYISSKNKAQNEIFTPFNGDARTNERNLQE